MSGLLRPWMGALLCVATLAACASGIRKDTGGSDRDLLTREEIQAASGEDLLTVIENLRPAWLRTRDRTIASPTSVSVVVDGIRWSGPGELRRVRVGEVLEVRFLSPADATTRYGPDMAGGAIVVRRRGRSPV